MPSIVTSPLIREKIYGLCTALLEDYFSEKENALVDFNAIEAFILSIPAKKHHKTRDNRYKNWYATYIPYMRTKRYITFDVSDDRYIIKHIINNHISEYPEFIGGLR